MLPFTRRLSLTLIVVLVGLTAVAAQATAARATAGGYPYPDEWVIECVDCPRSFAELTAAAAAVGPDGALHAVYGGEGLYHLTYRDGAWDVETIAEAGTGLRPPVMGIGGDGRVHALYVVGQTGSLRHAYQTASGWQIETLPFLADAYAPVSYTHLDVYKRQSPWWATRRRRRGRRTGRGRAI